MMPDTYQRKHKEEREKKYYSIFLIITFILITIIHFSSVNNEINGLGGDNAKYILLAKSLSSFEGYKDFIPGNTPHTHYPPIFPLLLTPIIWLFGINFFAFHIVVVMTELAALVILYQLFKRQTGESVALITCLIFSINPFINLSLVRILSEFPYIMMSSLALLLSEKAEKSCKNNYIKYIWLPIAISLTYLTRTAGLSLLISFILYLIYRKRYWLLIRNIPIIITPIVIWKIRNWASGKEEKYFNTLFSVNSYNPSLGNASLFDFIDRIQTNITLILQSISDCIFPSINNHSLIIYIPIILIMIIGFIFRFINKKNGLMDIYFIIYLCVLLLWPYFELRKLMPIMPFLYFYLFIGLSLIVRTIISKFNIDNKEYKTSLYVRLLGILILVAQLPVTMDILKIRSDKLHYPPLNNSKHNEFTIDWSHFFGTYYWIKSGHLERNVKAWSNYLYLSQLIGDISPPGTAVIARKDPLTALYSGRPTVAFPLYRDDKKQISHIIKYNIHFILLDGMFNNTYKYLYPLIKKYNNCFKVVAKKGNAYILEVNIKNLKLIKKQKLS